MPGDFDKLARLRQAIADIGTPAFKRPLATRCANAAAHLVAEEFQKTTDPYRSTWARPKKRLDHELLNKTGKLLSGFRFAPNDNGFVIRNSVEYTRYHQYGTGRLARRQIIPETATGGIPDEWGNRFNQEAAEHMALQVKL